MHIVTLAVTTLATFSTTQALHLSNIKEPVANEKRTLNKISDGLSHFTSSFLRRQSPCAVWSEISAILTEQFLENGQCTDAARAAIRAAFHDCFNGACDGSLILAGECSNSENSGLNKICDYLGKTAIEKNVGVADLIQFAAAHAIKSCPGGPTIPVKIGRKDSSSASPTGILPSANSSASSQISLFASRGFSVTDLVALIGAHTTARQFVTDPSRSGAPLDSTPGEFDTTFYTETKEGKAPFTLQSDKALAEDESAGDLFSVFGGSKSAWANAFVPAMTKLSMLGVSTVYFTDCTSALPGGSTKRDIMRSPAFERLGQ